MTVKVVFEGVLPGRCRSAHRACVSDIQAPWKSVFQQVLDDGDHQDDDDDEQQDAAEPSWQSRNAATRCEHSASLFQRSSILAKLVDQGAPIVLLQVRVSRSSNATPFYQRKVPGKRLRSALHLWWPGLGPSLHVRCLSTFAAADRPIQTLYCG